MCKFRHALPQTADKTFLTDGGLETTLIFHHGRVLPEFASFVEMQTESGRSLLRSYYREYARLASRHGVGLILEGPTWRANQDYGDKLGFSAAALDEINRRSIELLVELRDETEAQGTSTVVSGAIGPRADGYIAARLMTFEQAEQYHRPQIESFARTEADMVAAFTLNYADEAIGLVRAARSCEMPIAISFTVETDGRLPNGESLESAIERTDRETDGFAAYFMINCAHPIHFAPALTDGKWLTRLRGLRANASRLSHAELNESSELDEGDPPELGDRYRELKDRLPNLTVLGGCCGTDARHVDEIFRRVLGTA